MTPKPPLYSLPLRGWDNIRSEHLGTIAGRGSSRSRVARNAGPTRLLSMRSGVTRPLAVSQEALMLRVFAYLCGKKRADERTRIAFLLQLRVCGQSLPRAAGGCTYRSGKGFCVHCIAGPIRLGY